MSCESTIWPNVDRAVGVATAPEPPIIGDGRWGVWYEYLHDRKNEFRMGYSFALPSRDAVQKIVEFVGSRVLLDVGAGTGLWSALLSCAGARVDAVDLRTWNSTIAIAYSRWYTV